MFCSYTYPTFPGSSSLIRGLFEGSPLGSPQLILLPFQACVQLNNIALVLLKSYMAFSAISASKEFQRCLYIEPQRERLPRAPSPRAGRSESALLAACKAFLLFICTLASCPDLFLSPFTRNPTN